MKNFVKKFALHAGLVLLGIFLSLILLEVGLRVYYKFSEAMALGLSPARTTLEFYDNPIIGHMFKPSQKGWFVPPGREYFTEVETNSKGWPDVEHDIEKSKDIIRIVLLGDSFVENIQVPLEKRFFRQLEKKLNSQFKKKVEIIALGRGNTGTAVQYLMLKNFALEYKPDYVVHMFLTANDVKNNSPTLQNDPYLPYFDLVDNQLSLIPQIKREDRNGAWIKELLKKNRVVELVLSLKQTYLEKYKNVSREGYPLEYHIYDSKYTSEYEKAWAVTEKLILESKKLTETNGGKYILVTLANNEQVNKEVQSKISETYPNLKETNLDFEKPDKIISGFCKENSITCWQMAPFYKDHIAANNYITHYFYEGHWNEIGTNLATEFLESQIIPILEGNP